MSRIPFFILSIILSLCFQACRQPLSDAAVNASYILDESLNQNNILIDRYVDNSIKEMDGLTEVKVQYKPLVAKAREFRLVADKFNVYIDSLRNLLVEESGGLYTHNDNIVKSYPAFLKKPKNSKDSKIPGRIFVSDTKKGTQGGFPVEKKLVELKNNYLDQIRKLWSKDVLKRMIFEDTSRLSATIALIENELPLSEFGNYLAKVNINNTSVAETYTLLRKIQNEAKLSLLVMVNFLSEQMGWLNYDCFGHPVLISSPHKESIRLGGVYKTQIVYGNFYPGKDFLLSVDGKKAKGKNGVAKYSVESKKVGENKFMATLTFINPETQIRDTLKRELVFEAYDK